MDHLFKKKVFGDDEDGILAFHIKKMNADSISKIQKLCESNPKKCSQIRPELCRKMFILNGYKLIPDDPCKMYTSIVKAVKTSLPNKPILKINISPCEELFHHISLNGDNATKNFFKQCGYDLPHIMNKKMGMSLSQDFPTIKIKKSTKKRSTTKR